jgi:hypothetical protein
MDKRSKRILIAISIPLDTDTSSSELVWINSAYIRQHDPVLGRGGRPVRAQAGATGRDGAGQLMIHRDVEESKDPAVSPPPPRGRRLSVTRRPVLA